jgi:uncharacterized protein HemX
MLRLRTGSVGSPWRFLLLTALLLAMLPSLSLCEETSQQKLAANPGDIGTARGADTPGWGGILLGVAAILTALGTSIAAIATALYSNKKASASTERVDDIDAQLKNFKRDLNNQLVTPETTAIIKNQGRFLDERDTAALEGLWFKFLLQRETVEAIRRQGNFADRDIWSHCEVELREHTSQLQRIEKRLLAAEQTLLDLDTVLISFQDTLDPRAVRKRSFENLLKRFPKVGQEGEP